MAYSLKNGLGNLFGLGKKPSGAEEQQQSSSPQAKSEEGIEKQEEALKPQENGEEKRSFGDKARDFIGGKVDAAKEKLHDTMGMLRRDDEWAKKMWKKARAEVAPGTIAGVMKGWRRPLFRDQCDIEMSSENFALYDAIHNKTMSNKAIYETFLRGAASPQEVNLSRKQLGDIPTLAAEGRYGEMDFSAIAKEVGVNLSDTYGRYIASEKVLKAAFKRITGVTPPDKVDEGYKKQEA